ncbi:hypothetical protein [Pseudoxanthomonas wuyuanensis]|uniref:Uncharacterized protein n=1 Tax=Pseudoxanthomonas wuyuanensis TaxID=1073196 RepID=A0A286D4P3_9GAMM|nr:hypothetical protein [Pseudoxanthomonas wuyuanensis]SOD53621.1 hypothetical protein SAMN06296416_102503 [Pseudoxanthomonas wuyuanensis]
MGNVTKHPANAPRKRHDDGQIIPGDDYDRLWRAQQAAMLLAAINNDVAVAAGVSHDATAAVAEYIRDDMLEILNHSQLTSESL